MLEVARFLYSRQHFGLIDNGCVPVGLFEMPDLIALATSQLKWTDLVGLAPDDQILFARCPHRNLVQCSHAAGPIQLKSAGKNNDSMPASKKQPSGMERYKLAGSYSVLSKLSCCKVLHFSKARGRNCACSAS